MNQYAEYILKILASKQQAGITEEHLGHRMRQKWAPKVPIDRSKLVDEVVRRLESSGISVEQAVEMFGDAEDNAEEVKRIWATLERKAEIENQAKVEVAQMQADAAAEQAQTAAENQQLLADKNAKAQAAAAKAKPAPAAKKPGVPA